MSLFNVLWFYDILNKNGIVHTICCFSHVYFLYTKQRMMQCHKIYFKNLRHLIFVWFLPWLQKPVAEVAVLPENNF